MAQSERELLESIARKISESKALNGGFDRMCVMIEHIQDKQEESGKKLDKVSEALYGPDNGLFSRVKTIESKLDNNHVMIEHIQDKQEESGKKLDKVSEALYGPDNGLFSRVKTIESKLDNNLSDLEGKVKEMPAIVIDVTDMKKFKNSIERVAGKQLEELNDLVRLRKHLSRIYWTLVASVLAFLGSVLYQVITRR